MAAEDNDAVLHAGRVNCKDVLHIAPRGAEGDWQWRITLRCDETITVPFAVLDGLQKEILFDFDDAHESCGKVVVEDEGRICLLPEYANCVVCVDTSS